MAGRPPSLPPEPLLQDLGPLDLVDVAHVREGDAVGRGRVRVVLLLLERRQPVLLHLLLLRLAVLVVLVVVVGQRQESGDVCGGERRRLVLQILWVSDGIVTGHWDILLLDTVLVINLRTAEKDVQIQLYTQRNGG